MLATVRSYGLAGLAGYPVMVEVDSSPGLPHWEVVGLAGCCRQGEQGARARGAEKFRVCVSAGQAGCQPGAGGSAQGRANLRFSHCHWNAGSQRAKQSFGSSPRLLLLASFRWMGRFAQSTGSYPWR